MTFQDQDFPWVFQRDEIDLLEDDIEDLFERFHVSVKDDSFERRVLQEYLDTELLSDELIASRAAMNFLEGLEGKVSGGTFKSHQKEPFIVSPKPDTPKDARLSPLYKNAKEWMSVLQSVAKARYEIGGRDAESFFRIYSYSYVIPLKVYIGANEEMQDDVVALDLAEEEYRLACVYIQRIFDALGTVSLPSEYFDWVGSCHALGQDLLAHVLKQIQFVREKKQRYL